MLFASEDLLLLKLSDFGLAKNFLRNEETPNPTRETSPVALANSSREEERLLQKTLAGTVGYAAPEVFASLLPDERRPADTHYDGCLADAWSCGALLFELLTGDKHVPGDTEEAMIRNVRRRRLCVCERPHKVHRRLRLPALRRDSRSAVRVNISFACSFLTGTWISATARF